MAFHGLTEGAFGIVPPSRAMAVRGAVADAPACPECGYHYGSAGLYEPLPEAVLTELRDLCARYGCAPWS